jgi:uncharacterized protein (UPF0332 family)
MNFNIYVQKGLLKKQTANFNQIHTQLNRAVKDLSTFLLVLESDPEWAATIAYQAMLRAGRALLFAHGYLPADGQQHKTVVEITGLILGQEYNSVTMQFEKFRKKRNIFFYDSYDSANIGEARKALETARKLITAIKDLVSSLDPQQKSDL